MPFKADPSAFRRGETHDVLGNRKDHIQVMLAKKNGRSPVQRQLADEGDGGAGLFGGHAGGRLIEHDQLRPVSQGQIEGFAIAVRKCAGNVCGAVP